MGQDKGNFGLEICLTWRTLVSMCVCVCVFSFVFGFSFNWKWGFQVLQKPYLGLELKNIRFHQIMKGLTS